MAEEYRIQTKGYELFEKKLDDLIKNSFDIKPSTIEDDEENMIYYSKVDGSYITRVGMEKDLNYLIEHGITEEIQSAHKSGKVASLGFNPTENKWYGWSHRAIFGFTIGSECEPGQCQYHPDTEEAFADWCIEFWLNDEYNSGDGKFEFTKGPGYYEGDPELDGVLVSYTYNDSVPNEKLRGTLYTNFTPFPDTWGRGSWVAETMEDAKQMAIDFARGVN